MSDERTNEFLDMALEVAKVSHYQLVDFAILAEKAEVSNQLIKYYFHNKTKLQSAILQRAIDTNCTIVIEQGERLGKIA